MVKDSKTSDFGNYDFSRKNQNFEWKTNLTKKHVSTNVADTTSSDACVLKTPIKDGCNRNIKFRELWHVIRNGFQIGFRKKKSQSL